MIRHLPKLFLVLITALFLAACQSTPKEGLSAEQVAVLKAKGFKWTEEGWSFDLAGKVLFETDSEKVSDSSRALITDITQALLGVGLSEVTLEGHTDNQGNAAYNRQLSQRRAQTVADVMLANGMQPNGINLRAMGQSRPIADNGTATGRSENRRVAIIIAP